MAQTYTPGLKAVSLMRVVKKRVLPVPGVVTVKMGDRVSASAVVAYTELPGRVHSVNVANRLGVGPGGIKKALSVKIGDRVAKGGILAESKPFLKWFKSEVLSPVEGYVESVSEFTGQILLREPPSALNLSAYIDGEVTAVDDKSGVTVETDATYIQGIFGVGGEVCGEIAVAVESPDTELLPEHILDSHKGKILIGGRHVGIAAINRARELGVSAVVAGGIHDKDLRELLGYDIGVAVTGMENLGITVIVTEGFGHIAMAEHIFGLFKARAGEKASASGATQIRAGVLRPEIIIPGAPKDYKGGQSGLACGTVKIGDGVRMIREPHFGKLGTVSGLPQELEQIQTESFVRVMEVTLDTGETVTVPRSNTELLER